jgi:hypothetical protein
MSEEIGARLFLDVHASGGYYTFNCRGICYRLRIKDDMNPTTFPSAKILIVEGAYAPGKWAEHKVLPGRTHVSAIRNISERSDAGGASGSRLIPPRTCLRPWG